MALEAATGRALEPERLAAAETVRDLIRLVARAPEAETAEPGEEMGATTPAMRVRANADAEHWLAPTDTPTRLLGRFLDAINRALMRTIFRLHVTGRDNLPAGGAYLVVANHASDLDPAVLAAALPLRALRNVYWSGDRDRLFAGPIPRRFCRAAHIFPVAERNAGATLAMAEAVLARGNGLVWFPESWRTPDGSLQRFLPGIGVLLARRPVPVVPAFIAGTFAAMPRTRRLPRPHPVSVRFGAALEPGALLANDPEPAAVAARLREAVAALAPAQD
jgi:long-chain acyl-CoA synthetase